MRLELFENLYGEGDTMLKCQSDGGQAFHLLRG